MTLLTKRHWASLSAALVCLGLGAGPAWADTAVERDAATHDSRDGEPITPAALAPDLAVAVQASAAQASAAQAGGVQAGGAGAPPPGFKSVFDDNWLTVGIGAGLVPTYAGSDDYFIFPLPLIVGRIGGVGIRPSAAGLTLDVLSPQPTVLMRRKRPTVSLGPTFRFRNDRAVDTKDAVVNATGRLDSALEVGLNAGLSFPAITNPNDSLTVSANVRWDILGAHKGRVIEPSIAYATPLGIGALVQLSASMEIIDDNFARYYFSVTPGQSAASGLPVFRADGGINRVGTQAIVTVDLDGNALNGGFNIYGLGGYSRLLGDGANTPFTRLRGSPNQFLIGLGVGYTF